MSSKNRSFTDVERIKLDRISCVRRVNSGLEAILEALAARIIGLREVLGMRTSPIT